MTPYRDAALAYVDRWDVPVFPLRPGGKAPAGALVPAGFLDASTDPEVVAAWWAQRPDANVGVANGHGADALDVDGPAGEASLAKLLADVGVDPAGWAWDRSGRADGGRRAWFRTPPGCPRRPLGPGLHWLGHGGYTVAPPSIHPSGAAYAWPDGGPPEVLPEVPAALAEVLRPAPPSEGTLRTAGGRVDRTLPGGDYVARTTWREVLEPAGWAVAGHRERVTYWRRPGKPEGVSATTGYVGADALYVFSTSAAPFEAGRSYTRFGAYAVLEHGGDFSAAAGELRRRGYGQMAGAVDLERPDFWAARPVLAHVQAFARARRASPWAVLGVVLARVVTATPPRVVLPPLVGGDVSLDLFAGLVGPSGGGKDAALRAAADAVDLGPITTAGPGSGEGLGHLFMRRERDGSLTQHSVAVLLVAPEVDTLTALGWQRRGATLLAELRKAYMGDELGFAYADPAKRLRVPAHGYRLGLVVGIQPGRAGELLGDADAGTPQRFVWLPATDPAAPEVAPPAPATWPWSPPHWGIASMPWAVVPGRFRLEVCGSARRAVDAARLAGLREEDAGLDSHAALARLKVAAALALLDGRAEVGEADWHLAEVVLTVSDATRARVAETLAAEAATANRRRAEAEGARTVIVAEHVEEANLQRVARKVSRILAREGGELAHAVLRRSMTSADRPYLEEAIGRLVDAGQVTADSTPSGHGQPGVRYRLRT